MAKVTGPLLSVHAEGTIGDVLTFRRQGAGHTARVRGNPTAHTHPFTRSVRNAMAAAARLWATLTPAERALWAELGRRTNHEPFPTFCRVGWTLTHAGESYARVPPTYPGPGSPAEPIHLCAQPADEGSEISALPGADGWATLVQWNDSAATPSPPLNTVAVIGADAATATWKNPDPKATHLIARSISTHGRLGPPITTELITATWKDPPFRYFTCGTDSHFYWIGIAPRVKLTIQDHDHGSYPWPWGGTGNLLHYEIEPTVTYGGNFMVNRDPSIEDPWLVQFWCDWHQHSRQWYIRHSDFDQTYWAWGKHPCKHASRQHTTPNPDPPPWSVNHWYVDILPLWSAVG